jgi:F-type H+-transporting ATPase subunit b
MESTMTTVPTTLLVAAEGANPVAIELLPLITTIVVFVIAFWILTAKVWPRITQGLDERDHKIREEIRAAEEARQKADVALKKYEASLAEARQEAADMIAKAKASAKAAAEELRRRNEIELAEMKGRAHRDIDAAKQAAITELHTTASELATAIAGRILEREINAKDQRRLIEESLEELTSVQ